MAAVAAMPILNGMLLIGYFHPVFECITKDGEEFTARMRLHITEPLDPIIFLDPRAYDDFGQRVNSANSPVMRRKNSYATDNAMSGDQPIFLGEIPADVRCFKISAAYQIQKAVINGYSLPDLDASGTERKEIAFTCHDTIGYRGRKPDSFPIY